MRLLPQKNTLNSCLVVCSVLDHVMQGHPEKIQGNERPKIADTERHRIEVFPQHSIAGARGDESEDGIVDCHWLGE